MIFFDTGLSFTPEVFILPKTQVSYQAFHQWIIDFQNKWEQKLNILHNYIMWLGYQITV